MFDPLSLFSNNLFCVSAFSTYSVLPVQPARATARDPLIVMVTLLLLLLPRTRCCMLRTTTTTTTNTQTVVGACAPTAPPGARGGSRGRAVRRDGRSDWSTRIKLGDFIVTVLTWWTRASSRTPCATAHSSFSSCSAFSSAFFTSRSASSTTLSSSACIAPFTASFSTSSLITSQINRVIDSISRKNRSGYRHAFII